MSLPPSLDTLYREWHALTEMESEAIAAAAWHRVADLQGAKTRLQPAILKASAELQPAATARPQDTAWRESLNRMLADLVDLEQHNQALLDRQLAAAQQQRLTLDLSAQNLHRLHRSYAAPTRGVWERYS
jgi:hypothetical protein